MPINHCVKGQLKSVELHLNNILEYSYKCNKGGYV